VLKEETMKTKIKYIVLLTFLFINGIFAQDVTTVRANSYDISDNLDLKAVASIFGDSNDLEDFERRLNDPNVQISNLDLNNDNRVDYLRVIEVTESNTHLIILQAVLNIDTFQDVATIEVERDRHNNVQVQVVGDVYMYGPNYIYEPIYVRRPFIFDVFWVSSYRSYHSPWYWGYYPTYYSYWNPYPIYRYRNNVDIHINSRNRYNYVNTRRSSRAIVLHNSRRANSYERLHPNRTFTRRTSVTNRHALVQSRTTYRSNSRTTTARNNSRNATMINTRATTRSNSVRNNNINRNNVRTSRSRTTTTPSRSSTRNNSVRSSRQSVRNSSPSRASRSTTTQRSQSQNNVRKSTSTRSNSNTRATRSNSSSRNNAPSRRSSSSSSRSSRNKISTIVQLESFHTFCIDALFIIFI